MMKNSVLMLTALFALGGALQAQTTERRATIRGGARPDGGKCTIEVVVDGSAQVEIRGATAYLKNLNGQPPQWRRFECDSPMPANPQNFHFAGVDGRGRQTLVRDPRQGSAVVQIDDSDNGSEGYTFDVTWGNGGGGFQSNDRGPNRAPQGGGYQQGGFRPGDRRFTTDEAVKVCQDSIRAQARTQFRVNDVTFRRVNMDDQPGRNDSVVGSIELRRRNGPPEVAHFSCSVNFDNGRVRSAQIDEPRVVGEGGGRGFGSMPAVATANCQRSVEAKMRTDGYSRPQFRSIRADDQPGRNDWVVGDFQANGRYGSESFRFSCSVDMRSGDVRSVDVTTNRR